MGKTSIEWTDKSWNPAIGCSRVSEGCRFCYAERLAGTRLATAPPYQGLTRMGSQGPLWTGQVRVFPDRLDQPLRWTKPSKIFVCDMGDLFHENTPEDFIDSVFAVMRRASRHTFQVLTKRPERMLEFLLSRVRGAIAEKDPIYPYIGPWPLPNVWLGVSVEDQARADERIPLLLQTPAALRFISAEPLLEGLHLAPVLSPCSIYCDHGDEYPEGHRPQRGIDWVIVGGESGPRARPCNVEWIRSIVRQCREAAVPCFVKQMGANCVIQSCEYHPLTQDCRPLRFSRKGGDPAEWPEDLRIREFPA